MDDAQRIEEIRKKSEEWEQTKVKEWTDKYPERETASTTSSSAKIPIKRIYTPQDLSQRSFDYLNNLGFPGEYPYTRGPHPTMYRSQLWTIGVYAGFGCAEDANKRYKYLLDSGADAITIALDLPTQVGLDSDHIMASGEVGRAGVAIDSLQDMEILFHDIPLDKAREVTVTGNSIGPIMLSMFLALGDKQGIAPDKYIGGVQNDIIKEFITRGTQIFPIRPSVRFAIDVLEYCIRNNLAGWKPLDVCGAHMKGVGSPWELAFAFADSFEYIEETLRRGLTVDDFARHMTAFFLGTGFDFFESIAKLRAARRMWAKIMKERYGVKEERSRGIRIATYCGTRGSTAQQPMNNIVRATLDAMSGVFGGVYYIWLASWDEGLAIPTEEAVRLSIRTQQILQHEMGLTKVIDPLGGSYYVEALTDEIESEAYENLKKIEAVGGAIKAIEQGYFQKIIAEKEYQTQKEIESNQKIVVGVNKYQLKEEKLPKIFRLKRDVEKRQLQRLQKIRKDRNNQIVKESLERLKDRAGNGENTVTSVLDCVRNYCTIGEICNTLKEVFGEYREERVYF